MQRIEYLNVVDKSGWREGPWKSEPDKIQWQDEATGLPCLIVRGPSGSLCGYVGVALSHPWHGKEYEYCDVDVHGGLTFAHGCADLSKEEWTAWRERMLSRKDEAKRYPVGDAARDLREWANEINDFEAWQSKAAAWHIWHIADPGDPDPVWWLGFDCAHFHDVSPAYERANSATGKYGKTYRDIAYVEGECRSLAQQIAKAASEGVAS